LPEDYKDRVAVSYMDATMFYALDSLAQKIEYLKKKIEEIKLTESDYFWKVMFEEKIKPMIKKMNEGEEK